MQGKVTKLQFDPDTSIQILSASPISGLAEDKMAILCFDLGSYPPAFMPGHSQSH